MARVEVDEYEVIDIPKNTEFDISFGNFAFELKRLVEAIVLSLVFSLIAIAIMNLFNLKATRQIAIVVLIVIACGMFALKGINGNSLTEHLIYMVMFKKNKRTTYYNDRVKVEKKFFTEDVDEQPVIPRERLEAMYHKYVAKDDGKPKTKTIINEYFDASRMFFEEDIDALGKPEELMSPRELKKYQKLKKKEEKEKIKKAKKVGNAARKTHQPMTEGL